MAEIHERWQLETAHEISRSAIVLLLKVPIPAEHEPALERINEALHDLLEECSEVSVDCSANPTTQWNYDNDGKPIQN